MTRADNIPKTVTVPVGIVIRRLPGTTRWSKWVWKVSALLTGAGPGRWQVLRTEGEVTEYHAATVPLTLYRTDTEAYLTALNGVPPSVFAIMRAVPAVNDGRPDVVLITASAYEAQDYADNGEDIVERVPMPDALQAWISQFVQQHHSEEAFIKRKRRDYMTDRSEDGIGDPRIRQTADVFRAPRRLKDHGK